VVHAAGWVSLGSDPSGESLAVNVEATRDLLADDRFLSIGRLTTDGHKAGEAHLGENVIEALVKPLGIVKGISDLPWHKDCSLGRHSYRCCSLTVGISVTGADAASGQLRVVPGSHRTLSWPSFVRPGLDLEAMDLPTRTGDVTVHLSCTLHEAMPPVTAERKVMYTSFSLPAPEGGVGRHDAGLSALRERAYLLRDQPPNEARAATA
jgi:hypothetical protein